MENHILKLLDFEYTILSSGFNKKKTQTPFFRGKYKIGIRASPLKMEVSFFNWQSVNWIQKPKKKKSQSKCIFEFHSIYCSYTSDTQGEKKIRTPLVLMKLVSFSFLLKTFLFEFFSRLKPFLDEFHT